MAKGGAIFAFQVDERQIPPTLRLGFSPDYGYSYGIRDFTPSYYTVDQSAENFYQDIFYTKGLNSEIAVAKSGVYFILVVGNAQATKILSSLF